MSDYFAGAAGVCAGACVAGIGVAAAGLVGVAGAGDDDSVGAITVVSLLLTKLRLESRIRPIRTAANVHVLLSRKSVVF